MRCGGIVVVNSPSGDGLQGWERAASDVQSAVNDPLCSLHLLSRAP